MFIVLRLALGSALLWLLLTTPRIKMRTKTEVKAKLHTKIFLVSENIFFSLKLLVLTIHKIF